MFSIALIFHMLFIQRSFSAEFRVLHSDKEQWLFWGMWARKEKGTKIVKESKKCPCWALGKRKSLIGRQRILTRQSFNITPIALLQGMILSFHSIANMARTYSSETNKQTNKRIWFSYIVTQFGNITTYTVMCLGGVKLILSSKIHLCSPFFFILATRLFIHSTSLTKEVIFDFVLSLIPTSSPYLISSCTTSKMYPKFAQFISVASTLRMSSSLHLVDYSSLWTVLLAPTLNPVQSASYIVIQNVLSF